MQVSPVEKYLQQNENRLFLYTRNGISLPMASSASASFSLLQHSEEYANLGFSIALSKNIPPFRVFVLSNLEFVVT